MTEKIKWNCTIGGGKKAYLSHSFTLVANYPMIKNQGHTGYVNNLSIGNFETQEKCMLACERIALQIIKDLYDSFIQKKVN